MKVVASDHHRNHQPKSELYGGQLVRPFECPERWDYVIDAVRDAGLKEILAPEPIRWGPIEAAHDKGFIHFLQNAWNEWSAEGFDGEAIPTVIPARRMQQRQPDHIDGKLGYYAMAIETAIMSGTWNAVESSVSVAETAQTLISNGERNAFALCRPPGHHAARDLYGGYCFLNNAAVAAEGFLAEGANRVAILDVDFHHGNGTQDIFYHRSDVLFVSLHGEPAMAFPHFLGYQDETGEGHGKGFNHNYPMAPGTDFSEWGDALHDGLAKIRAFGPDALIVSLGVDTFEKDPISFFKLTTDDFSRYGAKIAGLDVPTLFVMEGGYAVEEIGINTANVLTGYLGV